MKVLIILFIIYYKYYIKQLQSAIYLFNNHF